jgi:UDP-hydrolysing UDP-N-acetyl-D-glucosamine 2-epimerase
MTTRRICVVTGSRAEFGLLRPVLTALRGDRSFELLLAVTGMHLDERFGGTWRAIEAAGFTIDARVAIHEERDDPAAIARCIGRGVAGFGEALARLRPDLLLVLGDRFEILAAVQAALVARVPVAHIAGGDVTAGAWDDAIRHAISKMSHLHFVTNPTSARRLTQMGERQVHLVGHTGLDAIRDLKPLRRETVEELLGWELRERNALITYHPETLDDVAPTERFGQLLAALDARPGLGLIFTMPNADSGGLALWEQLQAFVAVHPDACARKSLGHRGYLSALALADLVIGNSSSGLYEVPSFGIPTVDIGGRQEGRDAATSVLRSEPDRESIGAAIDLALTLDCSGTVSPYDQGGATARIVEVLRDVDDYPGLLRKGFEDLEAS